MKFLGVLPFLNSHKDLDPSDKTDPDFWDCFGRKKNSVLNTVTHKYAINNFEYMYSQEVLCIPVLAL